MPSYLAFIATFAGIYALLALSLITVWGQAGMVNLGLAGFFALGAYSSALLTIKAGWPIALGWLAAIAVAGLAGGIVTWATRSMRGDYLAIVTLGFAEAVRLVAVNETWLTRGSDGVSGIQGPFKTALGDGFNVFYLGLTWALVLTAWLIVRRLCASPFGRVLRAIRDDDEVAGVAGKPVLRFKLQAFALGAGFAGLAGALYAHFTSYIAPDLFTPLITIYIFLAATAGGYTRPAGAVIGALLVMSFLEGTRFVAGWIPGVSALQTSALREFVIAIALIVILQIRPDGLLPERIRAAPRADRSPT
ncbi:MAG: branched-chain amino acid ABC transporter permease [Betaproteobacteria bacterium]|nr:branched-chain amino acid ABC transporter permease [Betaproteobacteria bacterium]